MKAILIMTALVAAPVLAQSDTSITTQSSTSKSADKALQDPSTPTAKDAMQPNDTSITTRSAVSAGSNRADSAGMATASGSMTSTAATTDYPWCSRTVTDGCRQRYNPK